MEYTLENLHKLIQAISPEVIKSTELSQQTIDDWIAIAVNERESVQVRLMKDIFSIPNEKALEIYIANCQSTLIGLADNLTACTKHFSKKDKLFGLYQEILVVIKSLLTFIEHHFTRYFNLDAKVPESYYRVEQTEIKKKIENVKFALNKLNVENVLIEILLQPLTTFVNENGGIGVTYRKLIYLKELLQEIKSFTDNSTVENNTSEFVSLLLYLNFNHLLFLNYFINTICSDIEDITSISERIEKLSFHLKQVNQSHYRPGVALYNDHAHIKEQITGWLVEEIYFLEKKHQLTISVMMPKQESEKTEPIFTSLSVSQLAFFVKLLADSGLLNNKNKTEVLKTITQIIRNQRNETISIDSLRNKYYSVDKTTMDSVKDVIIILLNQIKKYA